MSSAYWHEKCGELLCLLADITESEGELFDSQDRSKITEIDEIWRSGCESAEGHNAPPGWKLVPQRETDDMLDAALAVHEVRDGEDDEFRAEFKRTYRAMIKASPTPHTPTGE